VTAEDDGPNVVRVMKIEGGADVVRTARVAPKICCRDETVVLLERGSMMGRGPRTQDARGLMR
jgi:hypothetical protein